MFDYPCDGPFAAVAGMNAGISTFRVSDEYETNSPGHESFPASRGPDKRPGGCTVLQSCKFAG
jgi:hypothetical protein